MGRPKSSSSTVSRKRSRPARTPEAREKHMMSLAMDLAEQQLMEGTASSQVITHFLKLATEKEKLEREILSQQKELMKAKTEALESAKHVEELYSKAIAAIRSYQGTVMPDDTDV